MKKIPILLVVALALSVAGCQQEEVKPVGATAPSGAGVAATKKPGAANANLGSAQMQQGVSEQEAASRIGSASANTK